MDKTTIPLTLSQDVITALRTALNGKVTKEMENTLADITEFVMSLVQAIVIAYQQGYIRLEKVPFKFTATVDGVTKEYTITEYKIYILCNITSDPIKIKLNFVLRWAFNLKPFYSHLRLSLKG